MLSVMVHIPALGGAADLHISAWAGDWPVLSLKRVFSGGVGVGSGAECSSKGPALQGWARILSVCVFRAHGRIVLINQYLPSTYYISHTSVTETKQLTETA